MKPYDVKTVRFNHFSVLLVFMLILFNNLAFADTTRQNDNRQLFSFNITFAPSLNNSLDGSANATFTWTDWLQTLLDFDMQNNQVLITNSEIDSSEVVSTLSGSCELARVNQNILWNYLPFHFDWLRLHLGIIGQYVNIDDTSFGIDATGINSYKNQSSTQSFKPLLAFGGGFLFGSISLDGTYKFTPIILNESLSGSSIQNSSLGLTKTSFSGNDQGLETIIDGSLNLDLSKIILFVNGELVKHLGYNRYVVNGEALPYAYQTMNISVSTGVKLNFLKVLGGIPYIGAKYVSREFAPNANLPGNQVENFTDHWDFSFGFGN